MLILLQPEVTTFLLLIGKNDMNRRTFLHNLIATTIVTSLYPDKAQAELPLDSDATKIGENNKPDNFNQIDLSSSNAWKKTSMLVNSH